MEKKSIKDTTTGQEIPEPAMLPVLPSGYAPPKEQHLLLAAVGVKILNRLDLRFICHGCSYVTNCHETQWFMRLRCFAPWT